MAKKNFKIAGKEIGADKPCYVIAEISCNHEGSLDEAKRLVRAAAESGCDAVKIQTYTPDTITRNFEYKPKGTIWETMDLYKIYQKAYTPWEWYDDLKKESDASGITLFSSPFDETAVDFLESKNVPAYKVASYEIVDTKLLEKIASTGKPVIMSTGMASYEEIKEAQDVLKTAGVRELAILKCNSGYPGDFAEVNLKTIPAMQEKFDCIIGLSDHTIFVDSQIENCQHPLPHIAPLEGVKLGAKLLEMHIIMDRDKARAMMSRGEGGFDWAFSRTPSEMADIIKRIRAWESGKGMPYEAEEEIKMAALSHGAVKFEPTPKEMGSRNMRPSLWVVLDIRAGEKFKFAGGYEGNVDSIRPGGGLHIRYANYIDGARATRDIKAGEPLAWDMIDIERKEAV